MRRQVQCPAAEKHHPVLDPNPFSIECRIQGNLRPAKLAQKHCCSEYAECPVWRAHKVQNEASKTVKIAEETRDNRAKHTLPDRDREKVVA